MSEITTLTEAQKGRLLVALDRLKSRYDTLLVDTGAGISSNVIFFAGGAHEVVVVVNPEPTALADAYAVIQSLRNRRGRSSASNSSLIRFDSPVLLKSFTSDSSVLQSASWM